MSLSRFLPPASLHTVSVALAGLWLALAAGGAWGDSIWNKANGRARPIHSDDVARSVGDNISIVIHEVTTIANTTNRNMEKKTNRQYVMSGTATGGNALGSSLSNKVFNFPNVNVSGNSDNKFDATADYGSSRSLLDQITVTVEDVLPNGNMVVLGKREREVDGDKQIVMVGGIVRPSDIAFDNTVISDKVANFQITFRAKGTEEQMTNPGWFSRLLNFISPS